MWFKKKKNQDRNIKHSTPKRRGGKKIKNFDEQDAKKGNPCKI